MDLDKISVCILAKNASKKIRATLDSLQQFGEVILLDNQSSDDTREIAHSYKNVRVESSPFIGFGALKNLAVSYAKNKWILSLDSDEVLEPDGLAAIRALEPREHEIYAFRRKNHYGDTWIKACGWYPDYVLRLFHKDFTRFNDNRVHESLILDSMQVRYLPVHIAHFGVESMDEIIAKMNYYTTLSLDKNIKNKGFGAALFRLFWVFFKDYFLRFGFRYGYKGFIIAYLNANGAFFKYAKLHERAKHEDSHHLT